MAEKEKIDFEHFMITGGPESTYLGSALRAKVWKMAVREGISRQALIKRAIEREIARLEGEAEEKKISKKK